MANFLGGFRQLKNVLQIPLTGWFRPGLGALGVGDCADVWSRVYRGCLGVDAFDGNVFRTVNPALGLSVRLLDA